MHQTLKTPDLVRHAPSRSILAGMTFWNKYDSTLVLPELPLPLLFPLPRVCVCLCVSPTN